MVTLGIRNWLMIGVMAVLFIVVAKVIFTKYQIKGVSDVVNAV
jgi:hypothetical protein